MILGFLVGWLWVALPIILTITNDQGLTDLPWFAVLFTWWWSLLTVITTSTVKATLTAMEDAKKRNNK
jgi:hypothetical protein